MSALFKKVVRELNAPGSCRPSFYNRFLAPIKQSFWALPILGTLLTAEPALSQLTPRNPENTRYATGDIRTIGNTLMTCSDPPRTVNNNTGPACGTAQNSNSTTNANNLFYNMQYVDLDGDASTFNSSTAQLNIPAGATILWAGLYWHGISTNAQQRNQVKFKPPGQANYTSLTAADVQVQGSRQFYQGFADVTTLVRNARSGTYGVADVLSTVEPNSEAGWSLVVVYNDPNEPYRNLTVFDGLTTVFTSVNGTEARESVTLSGFRTPGSGAFTTKLGMVVYDGDATITGDRVLLNNTPLSNPTSPENDFFNGTISAFTDSREPNFNNQLGIDIDLLTGPNISELIGNDRSSATFTFSTNNTGEAYYPGVFTLAIDSPLLDITKTPLANTAPRGSDVTFRITVRNRGVGTATATGVVLNDPLPQGVTLVSVSDPACQNTFPCTLGTLTPNQDRQLEVTFRVPANFQGNTLTNSANVRSNEDPTVREATASVTLTDPTTGTIGDTVYNDANGNGVQDAGEQGIPGIILRLTRPDGTTVDSPPTGADGRYQFPNLPFGDYRVSVTNPPNGFNPTQTQPNPIAVNAQNSNIPTADFGFTQQPAQTGTIGDTVYNDANGNGVQDAGEQGIPGIILRLTRPDGTTVDSPPTGADGRYQFPNLPFGDYRVSVTNPPNGFNPTQTQPNPIAVNAQNSNIPTADFGFTQQPAQTGTIGDTVYNDANGNGVQDAGEQGIAGIILRLTRPDGTTVDSPPTGADGRYQFPNLPFGDYRVSVTNPPNGFNPTQTQPNPIAVNAQNSNIPTADFGFTQQPAQTGTIGDTVYNDANGNGVQDAGEQGIPGIILRLTRPDGTTVDSPPTGADGRYQFPNLPFGDYRVSVTNPPNGFNPTQTQPNPIAVNAQNSNIPTADFGFTQQGTGTISGRLFNAGNNAPLPGTTVELVDSNGNVIATVQTGPDGSYTFPNVPFGNNYTVRVPGSVPNPQGGAPLNANNTVIGSINLDGNNPNRPNVDFPYQAPPPPPTAPDLTITKTAIGPFVVGQQGTYQITVTNAANAAATTGPIQIVDTLPNGTVFFGSSGDGWSCTATGQQQITCTNPNQLAPGASTTLTITVTSTQAGSGTNVADVSTPGETNTGNNRAEAPTTINNPPNRPPVANDDSTSTNPGVPVNIPVLGNDSDPDNNLNPGSVTIITNPGRGTVTPNPDGTITYTPGPGFTSGTDTFVYQVCDASGLCDTATVTVTVPATAQLPPVAQDRSTPPSLNTNPIQVPPLLGTDPDGTVVRYTITTLPTPEQGTLLLNGQPVQPGQNLTPEQVSQLVLQPNPNFTGTVTFNYTVTDNQGLTSPPATVTIPVVAPGNQPPVAENRSTPPLPNTSTIPVPQLIGRDPDGTVVRYTITTLPTPQEGTLLLNGQPVQPGQNLTPEQVSQLVFQPNPNFTGTVTLNYTVTDNQGLTSPAATVTIPVIASPRVQIGDTVFNDVNGNGVQDQGEPGLPKVTVTLTSPGADGILGTPDDTTQTTTTDNNGNYSFSDLPPGNYRVTITPPSGFTPTTPISQTISVTDNNPNFDFGLRQNQPPVANNTTTPSIPSNSSSPVQLPPLTATDPDGSVVSFTIPTLPPPEQGTLFLGNPASGGVPVTPGQPIPADQIGNLFFQPNPNFTGNVTIPFTATDNQGAVSPPATLTIPVTAPNQPPVANNDVAGTNPGQSVTINPLINDRSPDGTPLNPASLRIVSNPTNGTVQVNPDGTITYTPNPGFTTGTDSFVYEICDNRGICDTATITVSVPAPVQQPPVANDDRASTNPNTPVVINVLDNDTDPNNNLNPTNVTIVTPPTNGTVSVNPVTGQITYTPNPGFNSGTDTFEYQVCDTTGQCDRATVTVTVPVTATNPPVANNDSTSTNPNTPVLIDILNNDSDPDNNLNPRTVTIISPPANGTVRVNPDGTVVYTPNPGFTNGTDIFTYQVCDSTGLCDTATVTVTVPTLVPRPPVATNDSTSTNPGTPVLINVAANDRDPDGNLDPTTVQVINQPSNGTVRIDPATGNIIYTPNPGFTRGTDTFTYRICDTTGLCSEATVTVTVPVATNPPPVANPDAIATNPNNPVTINVLGNDSGNLNPATLRIVTPPGNGRVVINPDGTVTYIPNPGFTSGTDTFTYQICDTAGNCTEGRVTVAVPQPSPTQAEVQVNLTAPTTPIAAGTNVTFNGVVTNNGPGIAQEVTLTFPLPAGVTFVSATPSQGTCVESNGVVTCNLGNVNPGQTVSIPIVLRPTQPETINLTTTVAAQNEAIVNNNTATAAAVAIAGTPRVILVKRITAVTSNGTTTNFTNFVDDPSTQNDNASGWSSLRPVGEIQPSAPVRSGDIVEYTVYFLSEGNVPAQNVNFCDAIPSDTTFIADGFGPRTGIQLNQAGTNSSLTNAQDGDVGAFFSPLSPLPNGNACAEQSNRNGSVILNLREITNTPNGNVGFIRFRVTID